jgi:hypothetical protein
MNSKIKLDPIIKMEQNKKLTLADKVKIALIEDNTFFDSLEDNIDCYNGVPFYFATINEIASKTVRRFPDLITHKLDNPRFKGSISKVFNQIRAEISSLFTAKRAQAHNFTTWTARDEGIKNLYSYAPLGEPDYYGEVAIEHTFNEMMEEA